ncbi:MAG TPA: AAA family ATPase [Candidatus Cybelea sp.]|nr:AAA family ATPase [Candidatus Cybelea sp.]
MPSALTSGVLAHRCDPDRLSFRTTAELEDLDGALGQQRAMDALKFGTDIRGEHYNIYALGPTGLGKHLTVTRYLQQRAAAEPVPADWCYVHNFAEPHKPRALRLPAGSGARLRLSMASLIEELKVALPAALESDDFRTRHDAIIEAAKRRHTEMIEKLRDDARAEDIVLLRTPIGFTFAPAKNGEVLTPEQFQRLSEARQNQFNAAMEGFGHRLEEIVRQLPRLEQETRAATRDLIREVTTHVVDHMFADLRKAYAGLDVVLEHLEAVRSDVIENANEFRQGESDTEHQLSLDGESGEMITTLRRYRVNLMIDHSQSKGAPVHYEDHPTHENLVGRIEHLSRFGALITDFNLIKPGALHLANGGYLVIDAMRVLTHPMAWDELKRTLRARRVRIESIGQILSLVSTVSLDPEPIPLDVKVVLIGDRRLYYLLSALDPDFSELFKVPADFSDDMDRTEADEARFCRYIAALQREEGVAPLDRTAVARVIDHAARLVEDAEKLSIHRRALADLLRESQYWAAQRRVPVISGEDVQRAIDAKIRRADRLRERTYEQVKRGTLMVTTSGATVGQVNGLAVTQLGGFSFGFPSRITARTRLGRGQLVDIEREVELGGPIHSKGVLILQGFLGTRYAAERPLSLNASLVFEQSYSGVEGDSASAAELCALLSSLAEQPILQSLAITGSVDQLGRIQPIGGVNEKIEGFFDVCRQGGLNGSQGVLIPASNVQHLMLRDDVVEACAAGSFRVYPIATIDEALTLLTGIEAGERTATGEFPAATVNRKVDDRLGQFLTLARQYAQDEKRPDGDALSGGHNRAGHDRNGHGRGGHG